MVPEGLEWQSAEAILDMVAGVGFNVIRMFVRFFYFLPSVRRHKGFDRTRR